MHRKEEGREEGTNKEKEEKRGPGYSSVGRMFAQHVWVPEFLSSILHKPGMVAHAHELSTGS